MGGIGFGLTSSCSFCPLFPPSQLCYPSPPRGGEEQRRGGDHNQPQLAAKAAIPSPLVGEGEGEGGEKQTLIIAGRMPAVPGRLSPRPWEVMARRTSPASSSRSDSTTHTLSDNTTPHTTLSLPLLPPEQLNPKLAGLVQPPPVERLCLSIYMFDEHNVCHVE